MEEGPAKFKPPRKTSIASFTLMCECPPSPAFPEAGLPCALQGAVAILVRTFDARPDRRHTARPFIPRL